MADTAAHLVDDVLPRVPVRQWVFSFPHLVRYLLACSPRLCAAVCRIFVRVVVGWQEEQALREGIPGAVVFTQRVSPGPRASARGSQQPGGLL
jgi:hypothetical protein